MTDILVVSPIVHRGVARNRSEDDEFNEMPEKRLRTTSHDGHVFPTPSYGRYLKSFGKTEDDMIECVIQYIASDVVDVKVKCMINGNRFWRKTPPTIPLNTYLKRLVYYVNYWAKSAENEDIMERYEEPDSDSAGIRMAICAAIYLNRLASKTKLSSHSIHRALLTSVFLSLKVVDDYPMPLNFCSKMGGLQSAQELLKLELYMASELEYNLHISDDEYYQMKSHLIKMV